jgi:integrase
LGSAAALRIDAVRAEAFRLYEQVHTFKLDPAHTHKESAQAAQQTFAVTVDEYLEARERKTSRGKKSRARTLTNHKRHLKEQAKGLHSLRMDRISPRDISAVLKRVCEGSGPAQADRLRSSISGLFRWAVRQHYCKENPALATDTAGANGPREVFLTDSELVAVWHALPDDHYGALVKQLILCGARREEIGAMRWSWIKTEPFEVKGQAICPPVLALPGEWNLPTKSKYPGFQGTKNHCDHYLPLSTFAFDIIRGLERHPNSDLVFFGHGDNGFVSWKRPIERLRKKVGLDKHFTLHDLRRTVATGLGARKTPPHVIEAILNHIGGFGKSGVSNPRLARIYNTYRYQPEMREALEAWGNHVKALVGPQFRAVA